MRQRILAINEDPATLQIKTGILRRQGYLVEEARSGEDALRKARHTPFDLVLVDLALTSISALSLLRDLKGIDHTLPVIICCIEAQSGEALEAIRQGAYDYLVRPFQTPRLLLKVHNALEQKRLHGLVDLLEERIHGRQRFGNIVGGSPGMQLVYHNIEQLGPTQVNLLISGEPGVGKNLVARQIHKISLRREMPLHVVSGKELSDMQAKAESLAHVFSVEAGSTVVLQEVAELSAGIQNLLCRLLRRAGAALSYVAIDRGDDVRIISTTTTDLDSAMEEGKLLPELYGHLGGFHVWIPPLRDRIEDLPLLLRHLFEQECSAAGKPQNYLSPRSLEMLSGHDWPGNVRELEDLVKHLAANSIHRVIGPRDISSQDCAMLKSPRVQTLEEYESAYIERVLALVAGNMGKAAKLLGIPRSTFYRKLRKP